MGKTKFYFIEYFVVIFCLVLFVANNVYPAALEKGYVSDMLFLTVREGPGNNYKVLETLKSNDPVEIMEKQDKYYKVKTDDGIIGWVEKQYITDKLPQTLIVEDLKKKMSALEDKNKNLESENAALEEKIKNMKKDFEAKIADMKTALQDEIQAKNEIQAEFDKEKDKYESFMKEAGGGSVKLIKENRMLKQKNANLVSEINKLTKENEHCLKTGMIQWFLAGAGVLFAGWLIGQSIKRKKRGSSGLLG